MDNGKVNGHLKRVYFLLIITHNKFGAPYKIEE